MADNKYFVMCGNGCKYEGMTKEQIFAAINSATGKTPDGVDNAFVTKIKELNGSSSLKFWVGTQAEYNALSKIDVNCLYIMTDDSYDETLATEVNDLIEQVNGIDNKVGDINRVLYESDDNEESTPENLTVEGLSKYNQVLVLFDVSAGWSTGTEESFTQSNISAICTKIFFTNATAMTGTAATMISLTSTVGGDKSEIANAVVSFSMIVDGDIITGVSSNVRGYGAKNGHFYVWETQVKITKIIGIC